jgi:flagellar biosynthesis protein
VSVDDRSLPSADEAPRQPPRTAVALQYERGRAPAPRIAATGKGAIADRIIAIAREHNVPVREDPDLVQLLAKLDLGDAIPGELYPVIAEVFAFVYRLNAGQAGRR